MRLTRLIGRDFRNLAPFDLDTDARYVVFHGPNAQGKTNALEAVYLLATLKGLRGRQRAEWIRWGSESASVSGWVESAGIIRQYRVDLTRAARTTELDGKRTADLGEWFGGIRCVCFTPQDGEIVSGEPANRRQWLDRAAFTAAPAHLDVVRACRRVLAQKGAALRADRPDPALLDALDAQLAAVGADLVARRVAMLRALEPHVRQVHRTLAGGTGEVVLSYRTCAPGDDLAARRAALAAVLRDARPKEVRRGVTLTGPQTDEVAIRLDGHAARIYGSRGQVRSLVLSLKLAELIAARDRGEVPLFLIDDVSSELDRARTERLVHELAALGAQVWATTTTPEHMGALPADQTLRIAVRGGSLSIDPPA